MLDTWDYNDKDALDWARGLSRTIEMPHSLFTEYDENENYNQWKIVSSVTDAILRNAPDCVAVSSSRVLIRFHMRQLASGKIILIGLGTALDDCWVNAVHDSIIAVWPGQISLRQHLEKWASLNMYEPRI